MKIVNQSVEILDILDSEAVYGRIELAARTCYKSEPGKADAEDFIRFLIKRGHESVLEHVSFSVRFIVDRGVSHELVRHRIASFSQESTRYCNYSQDKFDNELTFIRPPFKNKADFLVWGNLMQDIENAYIYYTINSVPPELARSILPNSLKTEVIMTANIREWRHFLKLRTSKAAHPQMREVAIELLNQVKTRIPVLFEDIVVG